jgi:glycosyltransferase involved in cell wall biosynthesis
MSISIITPHFNDFKGIKRTHECLKKQNSDAWEWIIVDDFSDASTKKQLQDYFASEKCTHIKLVLNSKKTNASVCRNIGIDNATSSHLVFLDSDDVISEKFVSNRLIEVQDFTVFKNSNILDEKGNNKPAPTASTNYLEHFLQAKFIWPITAILWNKSFLIKIGKFNPELKRLQDIELSIRALLKSNNYQVIENEADFFYCVAPINVSKRPVHIICESVNYLITNLATQYNLPSAQKKLVKGYYYLCVRYFNRSKNKKDISYVRKSLKLFYKLKYISLFSYLKGLFVLKLYELNLISNNFFIRINRYFFK